MEKNDKRQLLAAFSLVGGMGLSMAATVAAGVFLGRVVDNWLGLSPWGTVAGVIIGMAAGIWSTYKRIIEVEKLD
ncbi:MAG: putative F0F1-ATPase subunit [Firmicutes bacterium]|nr:putative F0F1-ATPase subunit [Bacillota bacterium]